jgi:lipid-binding SYLF domain-containing protein
MMFYNESSFDKESDMKSKRLFIAGLAALFLAATGTFAADVDKTKKQAEIQKMAQAALGDFYKAEPKLKAQVEKASGYAVFSTFGLSFVIGGAGGKGLAHDNKTKKDTYMHQAQGSVGLQAGIAENRTLLIFNSAASLNRFIESGWEVGAGGGMGAAVQGKGAGGTAGGGFANDTAVYTLTRTGLQAGVAAAGAKFWKDKELN